MIEPKTFFRCIKWIKKDGVFYPTSEQQLAKDVLFIDGENAEDKIQKLTQSVTEIITVDSLPADAAQHTQTMYLVKGGN